MLKFAIDENFNNNLYRGLLRREPELDIVRIQDEGLTGASDPRVLEWCGERDRILLTHDVTTLTRYAHNRIEEGKRMPGLIEVHQKSSTARVVEDLLLIAQCGKKDEFRNRIIYVPLK